MQGALVVLCRDSITDYVEVLILGFWNSSNLPPAGEFHGDVIYLPGQELEIDRVDSLAEFKHVFLRAAEKTNREHSAPSRERGPTRHLQAELGRQRYIRTGPVWLLGKSHLAADRNVPLNLVFERFLPCCIIFVSLIDSPALSLQSCKRDHQRPFQIAGRRQLEYAFALDL